MSTPNDPETYWGSTWQGGPEKLTAAELGSSTCLCCDLVAFKQFSVLYEALADRYGSYVVLCESCVDHLMAGQTDELADRSDSYTLSVELVRGYTEGALQEM